MEIVKCEVCGSQSMSSVLDLGMHPMCNDLLPIGTSKICAEYPIEILFCFECFTAHQRHQIPKVDLFPEAYFYRARMTKSVLDGMNDFVESCEAAIGKLTGKLVLDIGCNDGSLLDYFSKKGCKTLGVEPTSAAHDANHDVIKAYFNADVAEQILDQYGSPDVITFTNVFAHIEDLNSLLDSLKKIISDKTYLVIENHFLGAVLEYGQFDTFYHEHPRTYSAKSFEVIGQRLGMNMFQCQLVSRYGGNIRAYFGPTSGNVDTHDIDYFDYGSAFQKMSDHLLLWKNETRKMIDELVAVHGPLRAKAFPGRAAILTKLLNLTSNDISAVYEITGSKKVGYFVPGTDIPILPEALLFEDKNYVSPILNLAWHLPAEVRANIHGRCPEFDVVDIKKFEKIL